jgi:predicted nucleic acid-binding protein
LQNFIDSKIIHILTCEEQLRELSEVFERPKLQKYFDKDQVAEFFELLEESSEFITIYKIKFVQGSQG